MPISVTCPCGARLEIDEKFLGKEIPCPDCRRLLPTKAPASPPPLDLPDHRRISGLAILSLALALVGAFTIVGTIAAIVVGVLAMRQIAQKPNKFDGAEFARAGVIIGAVCTFLTLAMFISPTVFGLDRFLRELALVTHLDYPLGTQTIKTGDEEIEITPPEGWAKYSARTQTAQKVTPNKIILANVDQDAFIAAQFVSIDGDEKIEEREKKVLESFYQSELIQLVGRLKGRPQIDQGTVSERKAVGAKDVQEITVDLRVGGIDRRFLIHYTGKQIDKSTVLIACARRSNFERLEEDFRKTFATFKAKN